MQTKNNKSRFKKYKKYFGIAVGIYIFLWLLSQDFSYQIWLVEQRYNIDIESKYISSQPFYSPFRTNYTAMQVYLTDGSKEYDTFWITRKKNDFNILPNSVRDTYAGLAFRDKYEVYLKKEVKPYFDEFKLYVDFTFRKNLPSEMSTNTTVEEYLAINEYKFCSIEIFVPPDKYTESEITEIGDRLLYDFKNKNVDSLIYIWQFQNGKYELYKELTRYNQIDMRSECYSDYYSEDTKEEK